VRLGVLLPTFREGGDDALDFSDQAADARIDGVFAYDHLWPMGTPTRPSLAPFALLSVIARRHENLVVGPLVARIGLVGTRHLLEQFLTLDALAPGRVICALGTGDKLSAPENLAYGLSAQTSDERRAMMRETASALEARMPVWIGAGAPATNDLARELGVTLNLWDASPETVSKMSAEGPVTWAGPVPEDLAGTLSALESAGAAWTVLSPQVDIGQLVAWRDTRTTAAATTSSFRGPDQ
jgi:alkanesulfonate monooxygenase SsuD/methylene tetrahydromethanopterin reductase-like flavin-dependent oxidoreductase (luciferase family)